MELTNISVIRELFSRHGFSFSKSLGQNFLINPSICPKIAEQGGANSDICVLEIGTGIGVLTKELATRCKKVVAIEIDEGLKPLLEETLVDFDNIEIIFADILQIDLKKVFDEHFKGKEVVVCANLPYYITSPVIMKLLEERLPILSLTVMVQKETADRICAEVGTRESGAVTVAVNYYSKPRKLFNVSRGSFMPSPNVDSTVIKLDIMQESAHKVEDEKLFFRIVRSCFSQRRKQILNPLSGEFKLSKVEIKTLIEKVGVSPESRAEKLTMNDFVKLYNAFSEVK